MSNRGRHKKSNQHLIIQILGKTIANRMMKYQKNWDNQPNLDVFLIHTDAWPAVGGFNWSRTSEGFLYWSDISNTIRNHPLYKKYKNDRS
jgi:hypothetical protein